MITYIYPYRDRGITRVKRSLNSLSEQYDKDFKVIFVDYGSELKTANQMEQLLAEYPFVNYIYTYSQGKPWSRSNALNIGIKQAQTDFVLSADIDMIFHPTFNGLLKELSDIKKVTYFKVGYLSEKENFDQNNLKPESYSGSRAKGICLYPKSGLMAINGFDEFFNCWGSEDEDVIDRLQLYGLEKVFYIESILVFHQYHKPFKDLKHKLLSKDLSFDQVRFHNDKKRKFNKNENIIKVNKNRNWGEIVEKEHYDNFVNTSITRTLTSYKTEVDFFLFFELKHLTTGYWGVEFVPYIPKKQITLKSILYKIWTFRNQDLNAKGEYSLKEVHDLILKFMLYGGYDFQLEVDLDTNSLELRLHID